MLTSPSLSGDMAVGSVLTADPGTWSGDPTLSYAYFRCATDDSSACQHIGGADGSTYILTSDDIGSWIELSVFAENAGGSIGAQAFAPGVVTAS